MNSARFFFDIVVLAFVLFGSAPLALLFGFIGVFRFSRYFELIVAGFLFELLYGVGGWHFPFPFPMFLIGIALFVIGELIRRKLR